MKVKDILDYAWAALGMLMATWQFVTGEAFDGYFSLGDKIFLVAWIGSGLLLLLTTIVERLIKHFGRNTRENK